MSEEPLSQASSGTHPDENSAPSAFVCSLLAWGAGFSLAWAFGSHLPDMGRNVSVFLSAGALVVLAVGLCIGFSRLYLHRTAYMIIGLVAIGPLLAIAQPLAGRASTMNRIGGAPGGLLFLSLAQTGIPGTAGAWAMTVRNRCYTDANDLLETVWPENPLRICLLGLSQLLLALGLGLWIGNGIDAVSHLIPIAVVATLADAWSVSAGATAMIVQSSQIHYFLLRFPLIAGGTSPMPFLIGLTDFLFLTLFYRAAVRFGMGGTRNLLLLSASFFVAVGGAIFFQTGLPVLPFMAAFFVIGNRDKLHVKREEVVQLMFFLGGIILVAILVTFLLRMGK
ncbi:MAG: hypothetical protein WA705_20355 [Candidatus Ozemobacteraceae bacterium]